MCTSAPSQSVPTSSPSVKAHGDVGARQRAEEPREADERHQRPDAIVRTPPPGEQAGAGEPPAERERQHDRGRRIRLLIARRDERERRQPEREARDGKPDERAAKAAHEQTLSACVGVRAARRRRPGSRARGSLPRTPRRFGRGGCRARRCAPARPAPAAGRSARRPPRSRPAGLAGRRPARARARRRHPGSASSAKKNFSRPRSRYSIGLLTGSPSHSDSRRRPAVGDRVVAPPPAGLLARLLEQAGLGEARGLGVELRVGKGPEVPDAELDEALEVIGRGRAAQGDDPEHEVRGRSESQFG